MKKLLLILSFITLTASAHEGFHHGGGCCYRGGLGWVAPLAIGGAIGYELSRPTYYVEPVPVIVQPQTIIQQPPVGYHWQQMIDPQTNTTKIVLVPN